MGINISETLAILLGDKSVDETKEEMKDTQNDDLPKSTWAPAGKYFGFIIGPGAKDASWNAPTENTNKG